MTMSDTRQTIMERARATIQERGYNGLSFRDLAKDVGIKSASIHYHFPSKGDLGAAVAMQYTADFKGYLDGLVAEQLDPGECIRRYVDVFRTTLLNENRMCLGGIMAAEHKELPAEVRAAVIVFTSMNVQWLAGVLALRDQPQLAPDALERQALAIYSAIEGAQLVARGSEDVSIYDRVIDAYVSSGLLPS